ncbi:carbohydrate-binding protein [Paenibacillus macerans]|uniref:carbohydrate-binding protein n=1 Tax=Paenibacillus macerans TaxID=44252 RepID=UPI003D316293
MNAVVPNILKLKPVLMVLLVVMLCGAITGGAVPLRAAAEGAEAAAGSGAVYSYEAEAPVNGFSGKAGPASCEACSGSAKVGNLYQGSAMQFHGVNVAEAGIYKLSLSYISGDTRSFMLSVNGGERERFTPPATPDWNTVGVFDLEVRLQAGANTLSFDDDGGYAPDLDKIDLTMTSPSDPGTDPGDGEDLDLGAPVQTAKYGQITVTRHTKGLSVSSGTIKLLYNTETGLSGYVWNGNGQARIQGAYSSLQLDRYLTSKDYATHEFALEQVKPFQDRGGKGIRVTVANKQEGLPTLSQVFDIYENKDYLLTQTIAEQAAPISANYIAPLIVDRKGGVDIGRYGDNRVLVAPFDNDMWSRYLSKTINTDLNNNLYESSELTAVFDNDSRRGFVVGSVSHDTWKTGIYWSGSNDRLNKLNVYGGYSSLASTHDTQPHGKVTGTRIASPKVFIGFFDDYRDGLETYGQANAVEAPPLSFGAGVPEGVPVGWNSWGAVGSNLTYEKAVETSDYLEAHLQGASFESDGNLYINLDSYWDNMNDEQLGRLVDHIRANGQKAGIYYGPFVYWGDNLNQPVEGTDGKYTYGDIVLRDVQGDPLPKVDGAYAVDPTHPGAKQRIDYYMNRFKEHGFEYIKLDFLSHGSFEGRHYDPQAFTGIQAYNEGMAYINEALDGSMFISASIAPLFPSQYAHSRRISCDVDGSPGSTEYQLNNLTYGWWQNGTIYRYTDPDYMTLAKGGSLLGAQTRVNAAAISGTVFLNSDDVADTAAREYMEKLLTNPAVNALATKGKAFRPLEGNTGTAAADAFILKDGSTYYLALFNYSNAPAERAIDFERATMDNKGRSGFRVTDVWTGEESRAKTELRVTLQGVESKLLKLEPVAGGEKDR